MGLFFKLEDKDYIIENEHVTLKTIRKSSIFRGVFYRMSPKIEAIGENCFAYSSLRHIALSPNLKIIAPGAFMRSESLEEIRLPQGLSEIRDYAFDNCHKLKKIEIPNSVKEIGSECFAYCKALEQIKLPQDMKEISRCLFFGCEDLKIVTLPEKVKLIDKKAFTNCFRIRSLTIPSTAKINCDFTTCIFLEGITVTYKDFKDLYNFFKMNIDLINETIGKRTVFTAQRIPLPKITTHLFLKGSELSKEEKNKITELLNTDNQEYIIYEEEKTKPQDNTEDKEIKEKVDEIIKICDKLDNANKEIILDKVNKLIKEYEEDQKALKPKFGEETPFGTYKKNITTLKPNLLANLDSIKLKLSREQNLIKKISDISKYKEYLKIDITELGKDEYTLDNLIKNIVYYSQFLTDDKKNNYLDRLKTIIDKTLEQASNEFENVLDNKIKLNDNIDYELELRTKITEIYDKVVNEGEKLKPFKILYDKLISTDETEYKENDDLESLINNINYIIDKLSNSKYKEDLKNIYSKKKEKYVKLLDKIMNDKNKLRSITYEDIEQEIRKDLHPLLELINNYARLDQYEGELFTNSNIITQLRESIELINNKEVINEKDYKNQAITSYVAEIIIKINNQELFDDEIKRTIKKELTQIINNNLNRLSDKKIESLKEHNKITLEILKEIAGLKLKINLYTKELEEYNSYSK